MSRFLLLLLAVFAFALLCHAAQYNKNSNAYAFPYNPYFAYPGYTPYGSYGTFIFPTILIAVGSFLAYPYAKYRAYTPYGEWDGYSG